MHGDYVTIYDTGNLDAEFRVFTAPALTLSETPPWSYNTMAALIAAGITTSLAGWTDPDTGKPAGWTEITSRTHWAGNCKTELRGNTIDWQAELSGEAYDDSLLGLGCPVVMWRRYGLPLAVNPSVVSGPFEAHTGTADDGASDEFAYWASEYSDSNNIVDATATVYSGTRAIKLTLASTGYADVWRGVTVTGNRAHSLTCYARGVTAAKAGIVVMNLDDYAVLASSATAVTTDWTRITLDFTTPATCTSIVIILSTDVAGTVFFDAVNLAMHQPWSMEPWEREYIGQFVANDYADDFRHGQTWRRTVAGIGYNIGRKNAVRMTFGPVNIMDGATVTAADTLADVSLETDKTEFYGGVADVQPSNLVDGKKNTVWISSSTPLLADDLPDPYPTTVDGGVLVSEVFFAPSNGYSPTSAWWFEVYNYRAWGGGSEASRWIVTLGSNATHGQSSYTTAQFTMPDKYRLTLGRFGIICGSRSIFERMTGGAPNAQFIYDTSESGAVYQLDPLDGFVMTGGRGDTIIWAPGGAARLWDAWDGGGPTYPAVATFDSDLIPALSGYSIRRKVADYCQGDADPAHFELGLYPSPGTFYSDRGGVPILVKLRPNTNTLATGIDTSSSSVELASAPIGYLVPGSAYIEGGDTFSYTGRTGNTLTGVFGISSSHAAETAVWPYDAHQLNGAAASWAKQTGWPLARLGWYRRKTPVPTDWLVYLSPLEEVRGFQESGFEMDYYGVKAINGSSADLRRWEMPCENNIQPRAWVRHILLVVNQMSDLGRAKLNEVYAWLAQTDAGGVLYDFAKSYGVAEYLLTDYFGLVQNDFENLAYLFAHDINTFAIGVRPLSEVLDDLARMTGCIYYPSPSGKVYWLDDPRWPTSVTIAATPITAAGIRGKLQWQDNQTACDWVILNVSVATSNGDPATDERIVFPYPNYPSTEPAAGTQGEEISGVSVSTRWEAENLAQHLFWQRQWDGTASLTCVAASPHRAGEIIRLAYDFDGSGNTVERKYIVETCEETRRGQGITRALDYRMTLRRFRD